MHEIFFQVFDKGWMEDGQGTRVDFKNTIILLTSNVGSDVLMNFAQAPGAEPDHEKMTEALRAPLLQVFPAALLGRMVTIPYRPLSDESVARMPEIAGGLSLALARAFVLFDPRMANPQSRHWEQAFRTFDLLL